MSSLLAFYWRRCTKDDCDPPASPLPPVVTASSSGDTVGRDDEPREMLLVRRSTTPSTPEGLRPRATGSVLRHQLGLAAPSLSHEPQTPWTSSTLSSPPISTNGFYGEDSISSPVLLPGKAKTAVGALVAATQVSHAPVARRLPGSATSILPPREQYDFGAVSDQKLYEDYSQHSNEDEADDELEEEDHQLTPYYPLEADAIECTRTPNRILPLPSSPISTSSASAWASPSSLVRDYRRRDDRNTSYNSSAALVLAERPYDFAPIDSSSYPSSYSRTVSADDEDDKYALPVTPPRDAYPTDGDLLQRKTENQCRSRQELVVEVLERLQDDLSLVDEVQQLLRMGEDYEKSTGPSLLRGVEEDVRVRWMGHLESILQQIGTPEEEYCLTPTHVPAVGPKHSALRDALVFCRTLVEMAVPDSEKLDATGSHWRLLPGMRPAVGILPPESPEIVRGGDTSLFSLPCDSMGETPMTSNVSITTTIETSPYAGRNHLPMLPSGLLVRRTIDVLADLLDGLSDACQRLDCQLSSTKARNVTELIAASQSIKELYQQVMAIPAADLKAVSAAFELDVPPPMQITSDPRRDMPATMATYIPRRTCGRIRPSRRRSSEDRFFSPSTSDMRTYREEEDEDEKKDDYDDLRRTCGSSDYDDGEEVRDGPLPDVLSMARI